MNLRREKNGGVTVNDGFLKYESFLGEFLETTKSITYLFFSVTI